MFETRLVYEPLPVYTCREEVERALAGEDEDRLLKLGFAIGNSYPDWLYAQSVCLKLAEHENPAVRANACMGLAYIARVHGQLTKHLVKPVLLRELRHQTGNLWGTVDAALDDIQVFLGWKIGTKRNDPKSNLSFKPDPLARAT